MHDELDLRDFTGPCRLFPLPNVVLFPHVVLPLHIFEPRYRQMTEDALAGDHLVAMVHLLEPTSADPEGRPRIEEVACLGRILEHERLPDGRFNLLLLGRKRVRVIRELPTDKLYRVAEVEVLEDQYSDEPDEPRRSTLLDLFRQVLDRPLSIDAELGGLLKADLPLGVLTDVIAHVMSLPSRVSQVLLAENHVDRRAQGLLNILRQLETRDRDVPLRPNAFPPWFSAN